MEMVQWVVTWVQAPLPITRLKFMAAFIWRYGGIGDSNAAGATGSMGAPLRCASVAHAQAKLYDSYI